MAGSCRNGVIGFLSTLSLRRATRVKNHQGAIRHHFYPRSPCGERLWLDRWSTKEDQFLSTLSLRRATTEAATTAKQALFLSTLSLRRATLMVGKPPANSLYFYPRSPCGERRRWSRIFWHPKSYFYPRSPCGERPLLSTQNTHNSAISIHALLAESDVREPATNRHNKFLSTLSLRRATLIK